MLTAKTNVEMESTLSAAVDSLPIEASSDQLQTTDAKPLSALNRQLTEDEFKSPAARKLLLGQLDEYEVCKGKLATMTDKYHEKDKRSAVLEVKLHSFVCFDWIYTALITLGSILIGYYASQPEQGLVLLIIGVLCVGSALIIKHKHSDENKNN